MVVVQRSLKVIKSKNGTTKLWSLYADGRYSEVVVSSGLNVSIKQYWTRTVQCIFNIKGKLDIFLFYLFLLVLNVGEGIVNKGA